MAFVSIACACAPSNAWDQGGSPAPPCISDDCGEVADTPPPCTPKRCDGTDTSCVPRPDGCGGTFQCNPCTQSREVCHDGADNDRDGARDCADTECHADAACAQCTPVTCEALNATCGEHADGCGGTITCGTCTGPQVCGGEFTPRCAECRLTEDLGTQEPLVRHSARGPSTGGLPRGWSPTGLDVEWATYDTFRWTAPTDGAYVFSHVGSGTRSSLFVRTGSCNGERVPGASAAYPRRHELKAGQTVYLSLFADSVLSSRWATTRGYYRLSISRWVDNEGGHCGDGFDNDGDDYLDCLDPDCAGAAACESRRCAQMDLGAQLPVVTNGPQGQPHERLLNASCGDHNASHRYAWTAPKDGTFVIHTERIGATIALWSSCGGPELACASNPTVGWAPHTGLVRTLQRGETVLILVEGADNENAPVGSVPSKLYIHEQAPEDTPDTCRDLLDNDGDGQLDYRDVGCKPFYPNQPYP